jgi:hypothetical protein
LPFHSLGPLQVTIKPAGAIANTGFVTNAQDHTFQRLFAGQGADDDIVVASTRAYVAAINKMRMYLVETGTLGFVVGGPTVEGGANDAGVLETAAA